MYGKSRYIESIQGGKIGSRDHGIAVVGLFGDCREVGSLDSNVRAVQANRM